MQFAITGKKIIASSPITASTPIKNNQKKITEKKPLQPNKTKISSATRASVSNQKKSSVKKQDKMEVKKEEPKDESPVKKEQVPQVKPQQIKQEQPEQVKQEEIVMGEVTVRYNHYIEKFPIKNGILSFVPIEQKYGFSDLFKGNFIPVIKPYRVMQQIEPQNAGTAIEFSWKLEQNKEYRLEIVEDEEEQSKYDKKVYKALTSENKCPLKRNKRAEELTAELKKMSHDQYGSQAHRQLLQQRDLEDVLYT